MAATNNGGRDEEWVSKLPKAPFWECGDIYQWEGFWFEPTILNGAATFRSSSFGSRNDDVLLASTPKTGTTWLKALAHCITMMHQNSAAKNDDALAMENPHALVPTIECITAYSTNKTQEVNLYDLLHTHLPYAVLPDSIKNSPCKIVYIARNPKDTLISYWHFFNGNLRPDRDPFPLEKAVDCFCSGEHLYGPFFEHVAEYWLESQKRPDKVLFVKYEDLKGEPKREVSKIADFLGRPLRDVGQVDEVLWRCSFERLKNLEVNKSGSAFSFVPNSSFFRKGDVGDWRNYLTPEMEHKIDQMCRHKLEPLGLFF